MRLSMTDMGEEYYQQGRSVALEVPLQAIQAQEYSLPHDGPIVPRVHTMQMPPAKPMQNVPIMGWVPAAVWRECGRELLWQWYLDRFAWPCTALCKLGWYLSRK